MATHTIQHFYRRRMGRRRKEPLVGDLHNEAGQISSEWTKGLLSSLGPHGSRVEELAGGIKSGDEAGRRPAGRPRPDRSC